jgi:hypothetical protein
VEIGGALYDSNNSTGSAGQLLSSVGSGISWTNTTTTASGQNILTVSGSDTYYLTASDRSVGVATAGFIDTSVVMTGIGSVGIGTTIPRANLHVADEFLISAGSATTQHITQKAYTTNNGTLAWEASEGQLFSISNNLSTGSIFSVNDISGIPSIDVNADGTVQLAPFGLTEYVGVGLTNPTSKLHVSGDISINQTTVIGSATSTLSSTSQTVIHTGLSTSTYRSVEYNIQATQGTNFHVTKILALHNGTTAYSNEYGSIFNNTSVALFDVDISAGNIRLLATGSTSSTTNYTINYTATKL